MIAVRQPLLQAFSATYLAVLLAELAGDRSLYAAASLTRRYRAALVYCGISLAFCLKAGIAVLFGNWVAHLPSSLVGWASVGTFFVSAIIVGWKKPEIEHTDDGSATSSLLVCFATVFLTEWVDAGQLTTAAMAARFGSPVAVWGAATIALMTKGLLGVTVGAELGRRLPGSVWRVVGAGSLTFLGVLTMLDQIHR